MKIIVYLRAIHSDNASHWKHPVQLLKFRFAMRLLSGGIVPFVNLALIIHLQILIPPYASHYIDLITITVI